MTIRPRLLAKVLLQLGGCFSLRAVFFTFLQISVLTLISHQGHAQTFTVTSNADTGDPGTLRWAVSQANAHGGAATINLNASLGTITLTSELPLLTNPNGITIHGNGNTIDGGSSSNTSGFRVFFLGIGQGEADVSPSLQATTNTSWAINNLTIQNANARGGHGGSGYSGGGGGAGLGGAIFVNAGELTLSNVDLSNNRAVGGNGTTYASGFQGGAGGGGMGGNGGSSSTTTDGGAGGGGFGIGADGAPGAGANGSEGGFTNGAPAGNGTNGGTGGNFGGGGGAGTAYNTTFVGAGGGGGVGGGAPPTPGRGGAGGFGGGAGGAGATGGNAGGFGGGATGIGQGGFGGGGGGSSGPGGFGAGNGAGVGGGGGGAGLGGAIFVRQGATLKMVDGSIQNGLVLGGNGGVGQSATGSNGQGIGSAIFLAGVVDYEVSGGTTVTISDTLGGGSNAQITGGLFKSGDGTLVLTGDNSYTGGTSVAGGTLLVNNTTGSGTGTGTVNVNNGGTLGGTGTISGAVIVADGGTLSPGNSAGTLTLGSLTLNNGSILNYELGDPLIPASSDRTQVNGDLTLDGILNITALAGFGDGTYRLFDYTGSLTDNGLLFGTVPTPFDLTVDTGTSNEVNLLVAAATQQFWDGPNTAPNGMINGGTGTWDAATTNWTNTAGNANSPWAGEFGAVFAGTAGTVTIADGFTANPSALDFQTAGYTLAATGTGAIGLTALTEITSAAGTTTISAPITGTGGIAKLGSGTLELSGTNSFTGGATGSFVEEGTLLVTGAMNQPAANLVVANGAGSNANFEISGSVSTLQSFIGFGDASTGSASISAGTWSNDGGIILGAFGDGTLEISGTGMVTSSGGLLGVADNALGTATVSSGSWVNTGTLGIGDGAAGILNISGTGLVSNTIGVIGFQDTATGTANISGGSWVNSIGLMLGDEGEGTVNLTGGTITAPNVSLAVETGSTGIFNVGTGTTAGILNAAVIDGGDGTAQLNFNHSQADYFFTDNGTASGNAIAITGSTAVQHLGTGTTILTGANTYTGGTTINGGVLQTGSVSALGVGPVTLNGGSLKPVGTLSINSLDWTGGTIASNLGTNTGFVDIAGNLNLTGGGQFVFTPDGGFSGNTPYLILSASNLDDTMLAMFTGNSLSSINPTFTRVNTDLYVSFIGASGGGTIQNSPPVYTPGNADFLVEGPVITGGPLENNTVNSLRFNPNSSLRVFNNLTVTSGNFNVPNGRAGIHGGNVITPGDFNKNGAGTLDTTGSVNVGGSANVNAGEFLVNGRFTTGGVLTVFQNALLGGAGLINGNVFNNGIVAPGNSPGVLTINGDFTQNSSGTLQIEAESLTSFDRLVVSGDASLAGTLQFIPLSGFRPEYGQQFAFLQARSISGVFDSILVPETFRGRFINQGNVGILLLAPDTYTRVATNQNQFHVARALDSFIPAAGNDKEVVSTALDFLTAEQYPAAFDQIMPSFHESVANIAINLAQAQGQLMQQQLSSVRLGGRGFRTAGVPMEPLKHDKDGSKVSDPKDFKPPILTESPNLRWSVWAQGNGIFARTTSPTTVPTYRSQSGGFLAGADYTWSESFVTGLFAGYQGLYAKYANGADTKMNGVRFGGYATYDPVDSGFYADAVVWGGASNYKTRRKIQFSTIDRTASANQDTGELSTLLGGGYDWQAGNFTFGPAVSLQYTYFAVAPFTESGADSLDLRVGQQNANSLQSYIGARAAYTAKLTDSILLIPEVRMFWQHEFLNNPRTIDASLDGGAGPTFGYRTQNPSRDAVWAGAGATLQLGEHVNTYLFYNADFGRQDYISHVISAGLNFRF